MPFYLTPEQDDFNQELQICIAEALYDVDSIVADPGAYTKEELAALRSQIVSNLEGAWEIALPRIGSNAREEILLRESAKLIKVTETMSAATPHNIPRK